MTPKFGNMEAIVAVGLAGNVVQFIQFTGQLVTQAKEIKERGRPSSLPALQNLATQLKNHATILRVHLEDSAKAKPLSKENQV
jgi:hypothetical protein